MNVYHLIRRFGCCQEITGIDTKHLDISVNFIFIWKNITPMIREGAKNFINPECKVERSGIVCIFFHKSGVQKWSAAEFLHKNFNRRQL